LLNIGVSRGEKGYAALPGREDDFKASLSKAIEYAVALKCPRRVNKKIIIVIIIAP
jgi:hydroxypyruvate isomerase